MKKVLTILISIVVICLCPVAQAFDGRPPHEALGQLSADKEMLFHQTMRGAWDATASVREQIKGMEAELKEVLTASEFKEDLFLKKAGILQDLHKILRVTMDEAVAKLASQFTAEERSILAELISRRPGPPPGPPGTGR